MGQDVSKTLLLALFLALSGCNSKASGSGTGDLDDSCSALAAADAVPAGGIFTITKGLSSRLEASNKDSFDMAVAEINLGCGTIGTTTGGLPLAGLARDGQDDPSLTDTITRELAAANVAFIVGAGGTAPTETSIMVAASDNIPYGMYFASGNELTRCTPAQLADPAIEKVASPIYADGKCWDNGGISFRIEPTSSVWGALAGTYAASADLFASARNVAVLYRDDAVSPPMIAGFKTTFEGAGDNRAVASELSFQTSALQADFVDKIKTLMSSNPDLIVLIPRVNHVRFFFEAWALLADPGLWAPATKPANFDSVPFLIVQSTKDNYSDISPAALAIMVARAVGVQPAWDDSGTGFQRWLAAYQSFVPGGSINIHTQMRTYDAVMLLALAMTKAGSTDSDAIKAELLAVANPPGEVIYPGEFARARQLLMLGADIDYEGASGPLDLLENGDVATSFFEAWGLNTDGSPTTLQLMSPNQN